MPCSCYFSRDRSAYFGSGVVDQPTRLVGSSTLLEAVVRFHLMQHTHTDYMFSHDFIWRAAYDRTPKFLSLLPTPSITMLLLYLLLPKQPNLLNLYSSFTEVPALIYTGTVAYSVVALAIKAMRGSLEEKEEFKRRNREWDKSGGGRYAFLTAMVRLVMTLLKKLTWFRSYLLTRYGDVSPVVTSLLC